MATGIRLLRRQLAAHGITGMMQVAQALPQSSAFTMGRTLGRLALRAGVKGRLVNRNLALALGNERSEAELERIASGFYEHVGLTFMEVMRLARWSPEQLITATEIVGREHLDEAVAQGRGVICITGHQGNWELTTASMAARGYRGAGVVRTQRHSMMDRHVMAARARHGVDAIQRQALRECRARLEAGETLVLVIDQWVRHGGVRVPFFGQLASSSTGAATLALKTGAPVVLFSSYRLPERTPEGLYRHRLHFEPPLPVTRTGSRDQDRYENTTRFQAALEVAIRRCPEQWLWAQNRWQ